MKIFTLVLILAASIAAQTVPEQIAKFEKPKQYTVEYDKFKDKTSVYNNPIRIAQIKDNRFRITDLAIYGTFEFTGQTLTADASHLWLSFTASGADWMYLRDHHLIVLADGERIDGGDGNRSSDVLQYSVFERLDYFFTRDDYAKIVNARNVAIQLGPTETVLNAKTLAVLRNVLTLATKPPQVVK